MQVTMQLTQILLVIVVVALTTILSLVGVQVFLILKEFRRSVSKVNKILDDAGVVSESVAKPVSSLSGFLTGLKSGTDVVRFLLKERKEEKRNA